MPRKRHTKEKKNRDLAIPTDSFSDIAFLLIIYFILATTLTKVRSITADLPSGEKTTQAQPEKTSIVNLRGSELFFNDQKMEIGALNERLAALNLGEQDGNKRVIMLESARGTSYENYFQALAAISAHGGVVAIVENEK